MLMRKIGLGRSIGSTGAVLAYWYAAKKIEIAKETKVTACTLPARIPIEAGCNPCEGRSHIPQTSNYEWQTQSIPSPKKS